MDKDVEMKDKTGKPDEKKDEQKLKEEEKKKREQEFTESLNQKIAEAQNLPIDQIKQKIKSVEARTQYFKGEINKMKVDIRKFTARIKENKKKLTMSCGLPHLISNVAEIFDLEEIDKDGSF